MNYEDCSRLSAMLQSKKGLKNNVCSISLGDPSGIFQRHLPKIMNYIHEYRAVRAKSLTLPKTDAAYGIPAGDTIDDLWGTAVDCGTTYPDGSGGPRGDCIVALPDYGIAFKMISAFRSMAEVFLQIDGRNSSSSTTVAAAAAASGSAAASFNLTAEAESMLAESLQLLKDTAVSANRSAVPAEGKIIDGRNVSCYPCHPGWISCKSGFKEPGKKRGFVHFLLSKKDQFTKTGSDNIGKTRKWTVFLLQASCDLLRTSCATSCVCLPLQRRYGRRSFSRTSTITSGRFMDILEEVLSPPMIKSSRSSSNGTKRVRTK